VWVREPKRWASTKVKTRLSAPTRQYFRRSLKARGLHGACLVISDQRAGLVAVLCRSFQGAAHQRCRVHVALSMVALMPKSHQDTVSVVFRTILAQRDAAIVESTWDERSAVRCAAGPRSPW